MSREKLILVPSERMDGNRKEDRNENGLVRMSKKARNRMGFEDSVEVYPATTDTQKRMKGTMLLKIFHAFSADLKELRADGYTDEELSRVGFVTTKTYRKVTGGSQAKHNKNIWISDTIHDTVVGADPEFLLFDANGDVVRANNVLGYQGQLGCDGAMAEVRPDPAITPEGLVENILTILSNTAITNPIQDLRWTAGVYFKDHRRDYPIGGHIHIGNPTQVARIDLRKRELFFKSFNKIMDELLAIPMIKIDGATLGRARRTECSMGKYGYFGEMRVHNGRLEHRTLSGMWLMHPTLTLCVIGTAKAIIDEVFRRAADQKFSMGYLFPNEFKGAHVWHTSFDQWREIPLCRDMGCVMHSRDMIEWLHKSNAQRITGKYLRTWYNKMKKLSTYATYAQYIDGLFEILKNNTKTFHDFDARLQRNWLEKRKFIGE
jgi:hypothetical protein